VTVLTALFVVPIATLVGKPASAAECSAAYTTDQLLEDLAAVEEAAQTNNQGTSLKTATKLEAGLACLQEKLVPMLVGRTYRSIAAGYMVGGNETKARAWFRTAVEVDSAFEYGVTEYGPDHPVRRVYEEIRNGPAGAPVPMEGGRTLAVGSKYSLDGRLLRGPEATPGRPHLLQKEAAPVKSWVIDGNSFPAEVLAPVAAPAADAGKPAKPPKGDKAADATKPEPAGGSKPAAKPEPAGGTKPDSSKPASTTAAKPPPKPPTAGTVIRQRPPEKTPLIILGGAVIAGAGGMYGAAIATRGQYEAITDDEDELRKKKDLTNRLYLGSIGVLAVGAGTLTWGIIVDGGTPLPAVRVRF
jgi:hypothetical protein